MKHVRGRLVGWAGAVALVGGLMVGTGAAVSPAGAAPAEPAAAEPAARARVAPGWSPMGLTVRARPRVARRLSTEREAVSALVAATVASVVAAAGGSPLMGTVEGAAVATAAAEEGTGNCPTQPPVEAVALSISGRRQVTARAAGTAGTAR